ncbi:hypothetical protein YC2023_022686 [Brassica napus]
MIHKRNPLRVEKSFFIFFFLEIFFRFSRERIKNRLCDLKFRNRVERKSSIHLTGLSSAFRFVSIYISSGFSLRRRWLIKRRMTGSVRIFHMVDDRLLALGTMPLLRDWTAGSWLRGPHFPLWCWTAGFWIRFAASFDV